MEEWEDDSMDQALTSRAELLERKENTFHLKFDSDISRNPDWQTQNLQNGLFSPSSETTFVDLSSELDSSFQLRQPSPEEQDGRNLPGKSSEICDLGLTFGQSLELPSVLRERNNGETASTSGGSGDLSRATSSRNDRPNVGKLSSPNKRVREEDNQEEVLQEKENVGRVTTYGLLSAGKTLQLRWRNAVFFGRTSAEL